MKDKIGFRIFKDFERPPVELVEKFRGLPASNVGDMVNRLSCMRSELRPFNDKPLLGVALTVKAPCGDNMILHKALNMAKPGDVVVVDGEGCKDRSLAGEMMFDLAARRGIAGVIIDGAIRDTDAIANLSMPVYATAVTPQGPYKHGPGEINVPIACCGQVVFPGDIILGDADGVVVIHPEYAEELAEIAIKKHASEVQKIRDRETGDLEEINRKEEEKYDKELAELGVQYIDFYKR
ncbi:MAG: RraA family protein [Erysipelotrichaceae bacterium]|nr:RraA family protein [Erysipelotrichaceae bacterium]